MKVLVDTSIWSLALRKSNYSSEEQKVIDIFSKLLKSISVVMIGPIRQEILSGISDDKKYLDLKDKLSFFNDIPISTDDYEKASEYFNTCRKHGIQGSHIDFLICSFSINHDIPIFTLDKDFSNYKKYLPIVLL
jgi:predicted nucleic acid-binding protein